MGSGRRNVMESLGSAIRKVETMLWLPRTMRRTLQLLRLISALLRFFQLATPPPVPPSFSLSPPPRAHRQDQKQTLPPFLLEARPQAATQRALGNSRRRQRQRPRLLRAPCRPEAGRTHLPNRRGFSRRAGRPRGRPCHRQQTQQGLQQKQRTDW